MMLRDVTEGDTGEKETPGRVTRERHARFE
jgi:hypothetical protein